MNLHRTSAKPDWENIPASQHTMVQKLAAATKGYLTPPNLITVIGLGIVIYGLICILNQSYWAGLLYLAVGRLLDIADGMVADQTGTKSPLGEIFDAAADKIGTILTIVVIIFTGITYWWVVVALIIPQVIIPLVSYYKRRKGIKVHPTRAGKLSMGLTWAGIVGLLVLKALGEPIIFAFGIYIIIGLSLVLGLYALWQYSTDRY
jgi:phosphatidylglycerophosphate synthase